MENIPHINRAETEDISTHELIVCALAAIAWQPITSSVPKLFEVLDHSAKKKFGNIVCEIAGANPDLKLYEKREMAMEHLLIMRGLARLEADGYILTSGGEERLEQSLEDLGEEGQNSIPSDIP